MGAKKGRTGKGVRPNVFAGLTVVGFSWAMVGALTMKLLADYGATVIRIETAHRTDVSRFSSPYKDGKPGLNRSGYFSHFSANMLGMALNMAHPLASGVARKLVGTADVVCENFTPGVMEKWGLGYDALVKIKPDIIMLRQSGFGSTGPYRKRAAFGMTLAAISGIPNFIGWPDREPLPVGVGAYTDCISPRFALPALIAALDHRDKTGEGQLIELSQFETALSFLLPAILDYAANGREPVRCGNRNPYAVPHGVYPCGGEDTWCSIAVFNDSQWEGLCRTMGRPDYLSDPDFCTFLERKRHEDGLDKTISEWTRGLEAEDVMNRLQAAGVPAGVVERPSDIYADPQLRTRDLFWALPHSELGLFTHLGASFEMSDTPAKPYMASPRLGEHTEYVCTEMLGMAGDEFAELLKQGVFE